MIISLSGPKHSETLSSINEVALFIFYYLKILPAIRHGIIIPVWFNSKASNGAASRAARGIDTDRCRASVIIQHIHLVHYRHHALVQFFTCHLMRISNPLLATYSKRPGVRGVFKVLARFEAIVEDGDVGSTYGLVLHITVTNRIICCGAFYLASRLISGCVQLR